MKQTLFLITLVLTWSACLPQREVHAIPDDGEDAGVEALPEALTEGTIDVVVLGDTQPPLTTCENPSVLYRTTSKACPTCPLLWVYPVNSVASYDDLLYAARFWNTQLGWNVVAIDTPRIYPRTNTDGIPRYGLVASYNDIDYAPLPSNWGGVNKQGTGNNCRRDQIFLNYQLAALRPGSSLAKVTWAHEIGHTLLNFGPHATNPNQLMYYQAHSWGLSASELLLINDKRRLALLF